MAMGYEISPELLGKCIHGRRRLDCVKCEEATVYPGNYRARRVEEFEGTPECPSDCFDEERHVAGCPHGPDMDVEEDIANGRV